MPSAHCDWLASPSHPLTFPIFSPFHLSTFHLSTFPSFHLYYLSTLSPFQPFLSFHLSYLSTFSIFSPFHLFTFPILFTFSPFLSFHLSYLFTFSPSLCFSIALKAIGKQAQGTSRPLSKLRGRHSKRLTRPAQEPTKG